MGVCLAAFSRFEDSGFRLMGVIGELPLPELLNGVKGYLKCVL